MAGENTVSSMGMYKRIYGDTLDNVVPNSSVVYDLIGFDDDNKLGDSYRQSITLTNEHGFTYNGSGGGVVTLNNAIQANIVEANQTGFEMIGRGRITYAAASRGVTSEQAFKQTWGTVLFNLRKASMKRLELTLLRGRYGLGVVSSNSSGVLTITAASWSPTTWAGMEGAVLEAWTGTTASETQHNGDLTVSTISYTNNTVTVTGTNAAVTTNDVLYLKGARTATAFNESVGLIGIAQNSGTLFGIDSTAANQSLWAGNTKSSFGTPTMGRFLDAVTAAVEKGLDEKCYLLVPPKGWEVLNSDLAAQRMFDGTYSKEKGENGVQRISYYGQAGEVELRTHVYLQRGEAVIFPKTPYKRVGSSDVAMGVPSLNAGDGSAAREIFFHLENNNVVEARTFSDQALFCDMPSTSVYISGITYPA